jgi:hypothetical protein
VSQIFAQMRYNDAGLLSLFGGRRMFDESPLVQQVVGEARLENTKKILRAVLEERFGALAPDLLARLAGVGDVERLCRLIREAVRCASLNDFRASLAAAPAP